jgi:hypothetical protein
MHVHDDTQLKTLIWAEYQFPDGFKQSATLVHGQITAKQFDEITAAIKGILDGGQAKPVVFTLGDRPLHGGWYLVSMKTDNPEVFISGGEYWYNAFSPDLWYWKDIMTGRMWPLAEADRKRIVAYCEIPKYKTIKNELEDAANKHDSVVQGNTKTPDANLARKTEADEW